MYRKRIVKRVRGLGLIAAVALIAATQSGCQPATTLKVTAQEDLLGLTTRLVFSTNDNEATEPRSVTLNNTGSSALNVTGLSLSGQHPGQFALAPGQDTNFSIPGGGSRTVSAFFKPISNGNKFALLTIANSSSTPQYQVALRGISARGTLGNTEPKLSQLMQLFGYTTNVGFTQIDEATTRAPVGDEVIAPYFVRVDASKPVSMIPIARYVAAVIGQPDNGRTPKNSGSRTSLYRFPPDEFLDDTPGDGTDDSIYVENQKTFPGISSGGFTFNPTAPFGLYGNFANYGDDRYNLDETGQSYHNLRVYPAKGPGGVVMPNTWIIGLDVNQNPPDKNYDYQDQVMLLTNARPEINPGPAPGSAATVLDFEAPRPGTILDKDSDGTGFTSVQPNKNGTQSNGTLRDLTGGTLRITSTVGSNTGLQNVQQNALQVNFDGSRTNSFVQARLQGPMNDLTAGFQQKAVYFGPDQDNYLKIEVEHRPSPEGVYITVFQEQDAVTATIGQIVLPNPGSVTTLDLGLVGDLELGTLRGVYRVNSDGAWTDIGTTFRPDAIMRFFSPQSQAGVLVSHTGSTTPIVGTYSSFGVSLAP